MKPSNAKQRLRECWLSFDKLAQETHGTLSGYADEIPRKKLNRKHRLALNKMVSSGEISSPVADMIQDAYDTALYHIWRSQSSVTCYRVAAPHFTPTSARIFIQQSEELNKLYEEGIVTPKILTKTLAALEYDIAFCALPRTEIKALYDQFKEKNQQCPSFDELDIEITNDARAAAKFIVELLTAP